MRLGQVPISYLPKGEANPGAYQANRYPHHVGIEGKLQRIPAGIRLAPTKQALGNDYRPAYQNRIQSATVVPQKSQHRPH